MPSVHAELLVHGPSRQSATCTEDGRHGRTAERSTFRETALRNIVLLAPCRTEPAAMNRAARDFDTHAGLLSDMQRLRGRIALEEGAIQPDELTSDLRHIQPTDNQSWHILAVDANGNVCGCARYYRHEAGARFDDLGVAHSALARSEFYGGLLAEATEWEMKQAREHGICFAEVGGWAVDQAWRCTTMPVTLALVTFALAARLGHCVAITTATLKSSSAIILRRLGGDTLRIGSTPFPSYFEPRYGCEVEVLRFDSRTPSDKYRSRIAEIEAHLPFVRVVAAGQSSELWPATSAAHAA